MQEKTIDAIIQSARTPDGGQIGDGKIFISNISDVIRVRTGENGEKAI